MSQGFLGWLRKIFRLERNENESSISSKAKSIAGLVMVGFVGIIFIIAGSFFTADDNKNPDIPAVDETDSSSKTNSASDGDYESRLETTLTDILGKVKGVGKVQVDVTLKHEGETDYATNKVKETSYSTNASGNQSSRELENAKQSEELVIIASDSGGGQRPISKSKSPPRVDGVLIVSEGASDSKLKNDLTRAVSALLDVPLHRITVLEYER